MVYFQNHAPSSKNAQSYWTSTELIWALTTPSSPLANALDLRLHYWNWETKTDNNRARAHTRRRSHCTQRASVLWWSWGRADALMMFILSVGNLGWTPDPILMKASLKCFVHFAVLNSVVDVEVASQLQFCFPAFAWLIEQSWSAPSTHQATCLRGQANCFLTRPLYWRVPLQHTSPVRNLRVLRLRTGEVCGKGTRQ